MKPLTQAEQQRVHRQNKFEMVTVIGVNSNLKWKIYLDFWKALALTAKRYYHKNSIRVIPDGEYRPRGTGNGSPWRVCVGTIDIMEGEEYMRRKKLMWIMMTVAAVLLSGCGMEETMEINGDLSSKVTNQICTTDQEEMEIDKELSQEGLGTFQKLMKDMGYTRAGKKKLNETEHNVYQITDNMSAKDTKEEFIVLNKNQAVMDMSQLSEAMKENMGELESIQFDEIGSLAVRIKYPFSVYKTNGTLQKDGHTVEYSLQTLRNLERAYAVSSAKYANNRTCTFKGVKNTSYYRTNKTVKAESEGVITSFKVNKVSQSENSYQAKKEGYYVVKAKLLAGNTKTLKFTIDKTKPITNIKAKKYDKKVTINFRDKLSGIKEATLNGKQIKRGKVVTKKGNYLLKVTDRAGNIKSVKFSIK